MSKFIVSIFLILPSTLALAQQSASIRHYQRSWSTDSVHVPCKKWELKGININVPDTLYDSGIINVKKMKYQNVKGFGYTVEIIDGFTSKVVISCKGKQQIKMLIALDAYLHQVYGNDNNCLLVSSMHTDKRKGRLVLALKEY